MKEVFQGILIGVFCSSFVWVFLILFTISIIEDKWKTEDLRAKMSFHYFLTRSKWKAYLRTIFS